MRHADLVSETTLQKGVPGSRESSWRLVLNDGADGNVM
jgi:hypothetical protein